MKSTQLKVYWFLYYLFIDMWRVAIWALGKLVEYFLGIVHFFWCVPGKVYPALKFLILAWEWYQNYALGGDESFFRSVWLFYRCAPCTCLP